MGTTVTAEPKAKKSKPDVSPEIVSAPASALQFQAVEGAAAGLPLFLALGLQRKLAVGAEDDPLEREADQVADAVMSARRFTAQPSPPGYGAAYSYQRKSQDDVLQRKCECGASASGACEECRTREEQQSGALAIQRRVSGNGNGGGKAHGSDAGEAPAIVHEALRSPGQPLDASVRPFMESRFGRDFGDVRVHTDSQAAKSAQAVNALAYTAGSDVFFAPDQYLPTSYKGQRLLAHELTHVVHQTDDRKDKSVQRIPMDGEPPGSRVPPPPPTPEAVGLPGGAQSAKDPASMPRYLGRQAGELTKLEDKLAKAPADTPEQREALRDDMERLVRLRALGLMGAHRGGVVEAKGRLVAQRTDVNKKPQPDTAARARELEDIRNAAVMAADLKVIKERLEGYRDQLHFAYSDTIFRRGTPGDALEKIVANGSEFMTEKERSGLRESFRITQEMAARGQRDSYWLFAMGATSYLEKWRTEQIFGVQQAIGSIFESYPLLASLEPEKIASGDLGNDALQQAAEMAYDDVIAKVDNAIGRIATGDIHSFDMPKAVEAAKGGLPDPARKALDEAVIHHQVVKFWLTLGLTLFEAVVVFIPVVGPIIAVGVAVGMLGSQLDDMLQRLAVARASTNPYSSPVGVEAPSTFEWVTFGVGAILTALGAAGVFRSIKARLRQPSPELLAEIGEPSSVDINRPSERPYRNPPQMEAFRGRPLNVNQLDPNKVYLWVIDDQGNFLIAPEQQDPKAFAPQRQTPGLVKHGDLTPGPGGQTRGAARAGGELRAVRDPNTGNITWELDNNSSYTFRRVDPQGNPMPPLPASSLDAAKRLLQRYGTDVSKLRTVDVLAGQR